MIHRSVEIDDYVTLFQIRIPYRLQSIRTKQHCLHDEKMISITIRLRQLLLLGVAMTLSSHAVAQQFKDTYPRIGAYEISGAFRATDPAYREVVARNDILIVGMWQGWSRTDDVSGELLSVRDVVVDIRQRAEAMGNPGIKIAKYTAINESKDERRSSSAETWDKLHNEVGPGYPVNNDWWARTGNGEHTSSFRGQWHINITEYVQRDSNGDTFPEWKAEKDYRTFFRDIPEFDMWFIDNWFYRPRVEPDWDGDGRNDDRNDESVRRDFRKGYVNALRRIRELMPNMIVMGNVDGEVTTNDGMLTEPEYRGQITALYEAAIGLPHAAETWGGWDVMMQQYRTTLGNAQHNILLMVAHGEEDDFATMRYGLASCLMDDGYYYYTSMVEHYSSGLWFDEYDVDLGRAIDPPPYDAWRKGVYMRRFEKGMVLVNPKGNGRQTVSIDPGYQRIDGTQDRTVNNGQVADTVTLSERDGLILMRIGAEDIDRPKPPVLRVD